MNKGCASVHRKGSFSPETVASAAAELLAAAGGPSPLAFAFVTPEYFPHLEEFSEIVRVDGHVVDLVGTTGLGLSQDAEEDEEGHGFSLLAFGRAAGAQFDVVPLPQHLLEDLESPEDWRKHCGGENSTAWITLANPFAFDAESWLADWNRAYPQIPTIGGLASGSADGTSVGVFYNGKVLDALAVGVRGLRVMAVLSQGCRPIGEPLTVTRAESNVIYSLGSHPAYEALESAFEGLSDHEKATAKGNLFAGLACTEYVEEFKAGDFVIRNILGADPNSGAVVIGGFPRVGQTLQYQLRDKTSADSEWRAVLRHASVESGRAPVASLLFSCAGRGSSLFGSASHDAGLLQEILGSHASAGFFCNGEIAPVGDRSCIHSYSASSALFFEEEPES